LYLYPAVHSESERKSGIACRETGRPPKCVNLPAGKTMIAYDIPFTHCLVL
jgi:hypothetical protein